MEIIVIVGLLAVAYFAHRSAYRKGIKHGYQYAKGEKAYLPADVGSIVSQELGVTS